jgi:hypothetical protein
MAKSFAASPPVGVQTMQPRFDMLGAISFPHRLNDMMQSPIVAAHTLRNGEFHLDFARIGAQIERQTH